MALTIKNFTVLNTTTGKMPISGRYTSGQVSNILSQSTITDNVTEQLAIAGTPSTIDSGEGLYQKAHMGSISIEIINDYRINGKTDVIYVGDGIIRLTYIGGTTSASNSLAYGFAPSASTAIGNITWNIVIAKNISQTAGDYFDITLPDRTFYPNLFMSFILLNSAWDTRTIVSGNICSIISGNSK